jgi:hypothetical protein
VLHFAITYTLADILRNYIKRILKIVKGSSEATLNININTKHLSTAVIREALFRAIKEEK